MKKTILFLYFTITVISAKDDLTVNNSIGFATVIDAAPIAFYELGLEYKDVELSGRLGLFLLYILEARISLYYHFSDLPLSIYAGNGVIYNIEIDRDVKYIGFSYKIDDATSFELEIKESKISSSPYNDTLIGETTIYPAIAYKMKF